jgi:hypothetical protein
MDGESYACDRSLTRRVEGVGHKLFRDSFFLLLLSILDDMHTRGINYCKTIIQNCKGMSRGYDSKTQGDMHAVVRGKPIAVIWKDKGDMHILTNIHRPPTEGNFYVTDYSQHMGFINKGDRKLI